MILKVTQTYLDYEIDETADNTKLFFYLELLPLDLTKLKISHKIVESRNRPRSFTHCL